MYRNKQKETGEIVWIGEKREEESERGAVEREAVERKREGAKERRRKGEGEKEREMERETKRENELKPIAGAVNKASQQDETR